jgi:16S rRNA (cytidine1402-2'-O)-methyltransferase
VHGQGVRVIPLPGASSVVAALSAAGDQRGQGFVFVGFAPAKGSERDEALRAACEDPRTQVLLEAPHRVEALVATLARLAPERRVTLARELSKQFETVYTDRAQALLQWIEDDPNRRRGEFVIVLHAMAPPVAGSDELPAQAARTLTVLLRGLPLKQAVQLAAEISGAPRNALYALALELKGSDR